MLRPYKSGPPATVSHYQSHGVTRLLVICRSENERGFLCHHEGTLPLDALPDVDVFELLRRLRLRCSRCNGMKVELRPDWQSRPVTQQIHPAAGWIMPPDAKAE
jgi:hypothetical protein